ncbi:MAG: FIST C-terminal domain-containing protein [Defluviitaleaceae bacterium]|nr:FIST C-terminal domain-containing protein [Defluviitaleaceae bacterium]
MQSYTLIITEVDDIDLALEELNAQTANIKLCKNTIGIASVNLEFLESGVYAAVVDALDFPVMGISAHSQSANGVTGTFLMTIMVLTANDCTFAHGYSDPIPQEGDISHVTQKCYSEIRTRLDGKAALALLYSPYLVYPCPSSHLSAIADIDAEVFIYGSFASADAANFSTGTRTVYGTTVLSDRLVLVLIAGNIAPQFYIGSVAHMPPLIENIGTVTAAHDNIVTEIDNTNVSTIISKIGFDEGDVDNMGLLSSVFIVNERDESGNIVPVAARGLINQGNGYATFSDKVPVGAILSVGVTTKDVIVATAIDTVSKIPHGKTALMYSCLSRELALLDEPRLEYDTIAKLLVGNVNYVVVSSGAEICPTASTAESNNAHDQTLIACVF